MALVASIGVTSPEPDVTNCGGVTAFMKVAHFAEAFNLPVTAHGALDRRSMASPSPGPRWALTGRRAVQLMRGEARVSK